MAPLLSAELFKLITRSANHWVRFANLQSVVVLLDITTLEFKAIGSMQTTCGVSIRKRVQLFMRPRRPRGIRASVLAESVNRSPNKILKCRNENAPSDRLVFKRAGNCCLRTSSAAGSFMKAMRWARCSRTREVPQKEIYALRVGELSLAMNACHVAQ